MYFHNFTMECLLGQSELRGIVFAGNKHNLAKLRETRFLLDQIYAKFGK